MKKQFVLLLLALLWVIPVKSTDIEHVKPVKNLIVLIPDGTSLSTVSTSRWYQRYVYPDQTKLAIDPYICGTVLTHSSNAPINDSAPATSTYMTGYLSLTGFVSTYPVSDKENDIVPTDPARAYQPLVTLLEAARIIQQKSTGLVFTCEFPHATPADCAAHSYQRGRYDWIAPQMVHNDVDVVIGGGVSLLSDTDEAYLKANGYGVYKNDIRGMRNHTGSKMWVLYGDREMPYDIDRDPAKEPALEEMTRIAIEKLSTNEQGFFLMVEGSKVDWAAHANDPVGTITDFLAFDKACAVALDFARRNGETAVVIMPDHGTGGITLGRRDCPAYDKMTLTEHFHILSQVKLTAEGFAKKLNEEPVTAVQQLFREYAGFELSEEELHAIYQCRDYRNSPVPASERSNKDISPSLYNSSLSGFIANLITSKTCIGFTTGGHTGEEVFLAAYHPAGTVPTGMVTNVELNHYLAAMMGLSGRLDGLTASRFIPHTEVFKGFTYDIIPPVESRGNPTLVVKNQNQQLTIQPNTNMVKAGEKEIKLSSVIVYVDANQTFYLPQMLTEFLK